MKKRYDPICSGIARHFLDDVPGTSESDVEELANEIQSTCEDYIADWRTRNPSQVTPPRDAEKGKEG